MKQNDVEMNRAPLNRYKRTFREQGGELDKGTPEGIAAWGIRKVMAMNPTTAGDERLAALETWEWDTTMRIREVEALEQIAQALEAQRLNHVASLTVGELVAALNPLMADTADAADVWADYIELDDETHENPEAGRVDHLTVLFDDGGLRGTVTTWTEDDTTAFYLMGDGDAIMMPNPDALHDLADRYRTVYAAALDHIADLWEAGRDAGDIPTEESKR